MEETYLQEDLKEFLKEFEYELDISFDLEESKENELFEVAKAKKILVEGSRDLGVFKGIFTLADKVDGNKKRIPEQELLKKLPQLIGKPITVEHVRRFVIGFILDYRYIEKEKKVIIYGIIFKNCFKPEWDKMLKLFKEKKIGLSSEIWSPTNKREVLPDGTFKIHDFEFAGCTVVFMDNSQNKPSVEEALVLEMAMQSYEGQKELIFSMINKENLENLTCGKCKTGEGHCKICKNLITSQTEMSSPIPVPAQPSKMKIICQHCGNNFEHLFVQGQNNPINCPNCSAILDQTGKIIYPPQIKNFDLSCKNCQARNNWLIVESKDNEARIKCNSCQKEYNIKFHVVPEAYKELLSKVMFLRTGKVVCPQCSTYTEFAIPSTQKVMELSCKKCKLGFSFDITDTLKRDIESVEESKIVIPDNKKEDIKMYILEESKLEISEDILNIVDKDEIGELLVESKKLSYEEKQGLSDSDFAVVITVKNKVTGEPRKIRKYPIKDEAHVRNALARLGQDAPRKELESLGVSPDSVIKKILAKARELGMNELIKRHEMQKSKVQKLLRKAVGKIKSCKNDMTEKDKQIQLQSSKLTQLETENIELKKKIETSILETSIQKPKLETASTTVGDKSKDNDYYVQKQQEVNKVAFGHTIKK